MYFVLVLLEWLFSKFHLKYFVWFMKGSYIAWFRLCARLLSETMRIELSREGHTKVSPGWIEMERFIDICWTSYGLRVLSLPASVCVCMCVSVNHQFVRTITCHPLKLQSPKLDQKCKTLWLRSLFCYWGSLTLTFKVTLNLKVKMYPILGLWVCPGDKSIPNEVRLSKFSPKMHLSTVKIPIDFGIGWSWSSVSFLTSNLLYSTKLRVSYYLRRFVYI